MDSFIAERVCGDQMVIATKAGFAAGKEVHAGGSSANCFTSAATMNGSATKACSDTRLLDIFGVGRDVETDTLRQDRDHAAGKGRGCATVRRAGAYRGPLTRAPCVYWFSRQLFAETPMPEKSAEVFADRVELLQARHHY